MEDLKYEYPYNIFLKLDISPRSDRIEVLYELMNMFLNETEKQVILGKYKDLITYREIARKIGISDYKVMSISNKALFIISSKANLIKNTNLFYWYKKLSLAYNSFLKNPTVDNQRYLAICRENFPMADLMVSDLNLPTSLNNALYRANIRYVSELLSMNEEQLMGLRSIGAPSISKINEYLRPYGYRIKKGR